MTTILIIDDDDQLRKSFNKLLGEEGYHSKCAASGEAGLKLIQEEIPDLVILDMRLPGMNGFETFKGIHEMEPKLPVIIMTAFGTTDTAIEATKMGAFDYILKPFDIPEMLVVIKQALEASRFMRSPVDMDPIPEKSFRDAIIGRSRPMQEVYKTIGRVSETEATVLIRGESGTGKELVARAVYQHSTRADRPFLVINCVAIPETLLESELFGYEKGAFTGATHRRIGKIEQANGGTVFLDEIGDMPLSIQAKILRLLQEKSIERLGGRNTIPVNVRIIAATNRDLESAIVKGRFREDLYYRLNVIPVHLPPLRERKIDIPLLSEHFLQEARQRYSKKNLKISSKAMSLMLDYRWPGNVRELENCIRRAVLLSTGDVIAEQNLMIPDADDEHLLNSLTREQLIDRLKEKLEEIIPEILRLSKQDIHANIIELVEEMLILKALQACSDNQVQAAKMLGISRNTLRHRLKKQRDRDNGDDKTIG